MRTTNRMKKCTAGLVLPVLLIGVMVLAASPASATAKSATIKKGVLTVILNPDFTTTTFDCLAGNVEFNGLSTTIPCVKVKRIKVVGTKKLDLVNDIIDPADLPNVVSAEFTGNGGNDHLYTNSAVPWTFHGGAGLDELIATSLTSATLTNSKLTRDGSDQLIDGVEEAELGGSDGNDTILASAFSGDVDFQGGHGDDVMTGGPGDDAFKGLDGDDTSNGNGGDDVLDQPYYDTESAGADVFNGGPGEDSVTAYGTGNMTIGAGSISGAGGDTFSSVEQVSVFSSAVAPTLSAAAFSGYAVLVAEGAGGGVFIAGPGGSRLQGGAGSDTYTGGAGHDEAWLFDTPGGTLTNTAFNSVLGSDVLSSIEEARVSGTNAANVFVMTGFSGPVIYDGAYGADTVSTGGGDDFFYNLWGGSVAAGGGMDTLYSSVGDGAVLTGTQLDLGAGPTIGFTGIERAELNIDEVADATVDLTAWSGSSSVDGSDYEDTVLGGSGADELFGWGANDHLFGNAGNDELFGGPGADSLNGGANHDTCVGGKGVDTLPGCEVKS